ncbi:ChbG/HpnK family deacetylase [Candidatus Bathyarchaeota archaeon]|nr:ChbG/HpnK family deacetylase [Candidatus Bathyarchaeota archaeon]
MKYLIVNGDDFGAGPGINLGVMEAHRSGILTSTSLLVNAKTSEEAAALGRASPNLSVGLHVDLRNELGNVVVGSHGLRESLHLQFSRFEELMNRPPTHLDSHRNVHLNPRVLPVFLELAKKHGLPLRGHSPVRYFSKFYGQWGGRTHLEQVSVERLASMIETEIGDGVTELSCHPGHIDPNHATTYTIERETELRTLCDQRIREVLSEQAIRLISYHDFAKLSMNPPS